MIGFPRSLLSSFLARTLVSVALVTTPVVVSAEARSSSGAPAESVGTKVTAITKESNTKKSRRLAEAEKYLLQAQAKIFPLQYPVLRDEENRNALRTFLKQIKEECKDQSPMVVRSVVDGAACGAASTKLGGK